MSPLRCLLLVCLLCFEGPTFVDAIELRGVRNIPHDHLIAWSKAGTRSSRQSLATRATSQGVFTSIDHLWVRAGYFFDAFFGLCRTYPFLWSSWLLLLGCGCCWCGSRSAQEKNDNGKKVPALQNEGTDESMQRFKSESRVSKRYSTSWNVNSMVDAEQQQPSDARSPSCMPCCFDGSEARCFSAVRRKWGTFLIQTVRRGIARYDMISIGVKVKIAGVTLNPMTGRMEMQDMIICNPDGYYSEYLAKCHSVVIYVNMRKLISSKGEHIELDRVEFHKLDIIYEKGLMSSNVDYVMNFMEGMETEEMGVVEQTLLGVTNTVARTVAHTRDFVSQEAQHVIDDMAPAPIRQIYGMVTGAAEEVIGDVAAVAGTTVMATSAVVSGTTHATTNAATAAASTAQAAGAQAITAASSVGGAVSDAVTNAFSPRRRSESLDSMETTPGGRLRRRSMSVADVRRLSTRHLSDAKDDDKEEDEAPPEEAEEWLVLHRFIASDITVRLASSAFRGAGVQLHIPDLDYPDCSQHVEADTALDMARFVMKSLLETVHQKASHDLAFALHLADGPDED